MLLKFLSGRELPSQSLSLITFALIWIGLSIWFTTHSVVRVLDAAAGSQPTASKIGNASAAA